MKNLGTQTLETDRLILRKFTSSDAPGMFYGWASDEKVTEYLSWNPASGRVMEKAGMTRDAVLKERRYHAPTDTYCDLVCYSAKR